MIAKVEPLTTARALRGPFDYLLPAAMAEVGVGSVVRVPFGRRRTLGVVVGLAETSELPPEKLAEPLEALGAGVPPELVRLALWLAREYCSTPSRGLRLVLPADPGVRKRRARPRVEHPAVGAAAAERPALLPEQERAVERVLAALDGAPGAPRELLLHGVTGSGKTEVYLAAVEAALARGRGAILLVPEIGLAPQAVARFRARLGDRIAVLHSALTQGQRYDEWRRLRDGEASVCVGPRSAVFAPVADLGLIAIDEEHDPSYKQDGDPCYDARTVARRRAAECGATLLAGTATPRPESWLELPRAELPRRVDGRPLPPVEVLDMREADPRMGPLHPDTWAALEQVRRAGAKAIVMVNRRGFAPWLTCRPCGHHWQCPNCDVSLIVHRGAGRPVPASGNSDRFGGVGTHLTPAAGIAEASASTDPACDVRQAQQLADSDQNFRTQALVCHHCAHAEPLPRACPDCGSTTLSRAGAGTEQVEALLSERLAPMPVFRLDADAAAGRGAHARILAAFDAAASGVLVGTQMVAKGHDFPRVTLSAIVDADATLRFPDFRAGERTFAMVAQLAGRSGRGEAGGEVIVQTLAPGAASIVHAARHDAAGFLAGEVERRRGLRYPPFSHLVRVLLRAESEQRLDEAAAKLAALLRDTLPGDADLLGPAPMFRVRNRHRRRLLTKSDDRDATVAAVGAAVERLAADRSLKGVAIGVDVDPQ